jgi:hypothetical protein
MRVKHLAFGVAVVVLGLMMTTVILLVRTDPSPRFTFVGQIIEPNGEPIEGVIVGFSYGDLRTHSKSSEPKLVAQGESDPIDPLKTDAQGMFTISGRGSYLWGLRFTKPGYVFEDISSDRRETTDYRLTQNAIVYRGSRIDRAATPTHP